MATSLTITAGVRISADPERVWDLAVDWPGPLDLVPAAIRPAFTRIAYAVLAPVARAGLGSSLARLARLVDSRR